jgi:hypothetical protein
VESWRRAEQVGVDGVDDDLGDLPGPLVTRKLTVAAPRRR